MTSARGTRTRDKGPRARVEAGLGRDRRQAHAAADLGCALRGAAEGRKYQACLGSEGSARPSAGECWEARRLLRPS